VKKINVEILKKKLGYKDRQKLATFLGVSPSMVTHWLNQTKPIARIHYRKLSIFARHLGTTMTELCKEEK